MITASNGESATLEELVIALIEKHGDTYEQTHDVCKKLCTELLCVRFECNKHMDPSKDYSILKHDWPIPEEKPVT